MTATALGQCFELLEMMNHGNGQQWTDKHRTLYALVLSPLTDEEGKAVVEWAALNEEWRPSVARLRQIAVDVLSPSPNADDVYFEILTLAREKGTYGLPDPKNPNVFYEGIVPSHTVSGHVIELLGGWQMICSGEAQKAEGLRKQVKSATETARERWQSEVGKQLSLPPERRDKRYFPGWVAPEFDPLRLEEMEVERSMALLPPGPDEYQCAGQERVPLPDFLKQIVSTVVKEIPADGPRQRRVPEGLTKAQRDALEAEIAAKRAEKSGTAAPTDAPEKDPFA